MANTEQSSDDLAPFDRNQGRPIVSSFPTSNTFMRNEIGGTGGSMERGVGIALGGGKSREESALLHTERSMTDEEILDEEEKM